MKALNPPAPEDYSGARESPESPGPAGELGESAKSSAPNVPAAKWRSPHCTRGWRKSSVGAKRPNGSATNCAKNCTPAQSRENLPSRARNTRVGVKPTLLR